MPSDRALVRSILQTAWEKSTMSQTQFAMLLRDEAALYDEAPEAAADPERNLDRYVEPDAVDADGITGDERKVCLPASLAGDISETVEWAIEEVQAGRHGLNLDDLDRQQETLSLAVREVDAE